jgi:hypothetical protein
MRRRVIGMLSPARACHPYVVQGFSGQAFES